MLVDHTLLSAAESYARDLLEHQLPEGYSYHKLDHTLQVVEVSAEIGRAEGLNDDEIRLVQLAAWLHDLGYVRRYINHEADSREIAREFLIGQGASERLIEIVESLIEATRLDQEPGNTLEEVLKDADLYNLATAEALANSELIRQEWKIFCNREFTDEEWEDFNYNFFKSHEYYTNYGREQLAPLKKENVKKLKKNIKRRGQSSAQDATALLMMQLQHQEEQVAGLQKKIKKIRDQRPDRGIETMFRTTYRTHISLSDLADSKANILLSINAIVISIIFANAVSQRSITGYAMYPLFGMLAVCMLTMIFAILATRPKVNSGIFTREDILQKRTNLLFFGNFYRMSLDDYMWGIDQMMKDADYLYGSMTKDIYFLGKVLAQKFKLLRLAYNVFMYGMAISLIAFALTYWLAGA
ncbi:MAG: DUF5706 domain-containing protein [Bacteroidia bacterium]|nr:DUF5706 domain-containing protein [Bacteroidia bacterium]